MLGIYDIHFHLREQIAGSIIDRADAQRILAAFDALSLEEVDNLYVLWEGNIPVAAWQFAQHAPHSYRV